MFLNLVRALLLAIWEATSLLMVHIAREGSDQTMWDVQADLGIRRAHVIC